MVAAKDTPSCRPASPPPGAQRLDATVVRGGFCIGCGACASLPRSAFGIEMDPLGRFQAALQTRPAVHPTLPVEEICPFSDRSLDEDAISRLVFDGAGRRDERIGTHLATYAGHVCEDGIRARGSSGGLGTWVARELLRTGEVDGVVHVKPSTGDGPLFEYAISTELAEVSAGSKSRYYPIQMSRVLREVRRRPGRYAFIGIPCFVKAVRLLAHHDPQFAERIVFTIALFCGHLKTAAFADYLAWSVGIAPGALSGIDFRHKLEGRPANRYGISARERDSGAEAIAAVEEIWGTDWGLGFFKYAACDFCDDVVGETADLSVGDAWLPEFLDDSRGTNVAVVRHPLLQNLLERANREGRIELHPLGADRVAESQAGGFRHRRAGLAYRLLERDRRGEWRPRKRVRPTGDHLSRRARKVVRLREKLSLRSHAAFARAKECGRLGEFRRSMAPLVWKYHVARSTPLARWRSRAAAVLRWLGGEEAYPT